MISSVVTLFVFERLFLKVTPYVKLYQQAQHDETDVGRVPRGTNSGVYKLERGPFGHWVTYSLLKTKITIEATTDC